ncbi:MAG: hypothetical protein MI976_29185, partial [Pseudomonadales bacterium]|nr:hypothetical protein [Pseudomonadales bacterium]
ATGNTNSAGANPFKLCIRNEKYNSTCALVRTHVFKKLLRPNALLICAARRQIERLVMSSLRTVER